MNSSKTPKASFAVCATVKAPLVELQWFAKHHLKAGASRVFLFFDDPFDESVIAFTDYRISAITCDEKHWNYLGLKDTLDINKRRSANAMYAKRLAKEQDIEWLAVIDHDELLYSPIPLIEVFKDAGPDVDVIRFEVWEALAHGRDYGNPFAGITDFKPYPLPINVGRRGSWSIYPQWVMFLLRLKVARVLGVKRADRRKFTIGHRSGKSAIRTSAEVTTIGSHTPEPVIGRKLKCRKGRKSALLHYDGCGFQSWRWKWDNRLASAPPEADLEQTHSPAQSDSTLSFEPLMRVHRWEYLTDYAAAKKDGEEALLNFYLDTRTITPFEKRILSLLGLIETIPVIQISEKLSDS